MSMGAFALGIRIKQFSKTRVFRKVLKVRIVARLEPQRGISADRFVQMPQSIFDMASQAVESRHSIGHIVSRRHLLGELFQVLASA